MSREDALANFEAHSPLFSALVLGMKIYFDKEQFFSKKFASFLEEIMKQNSFYTDPKAAWDLSRKATDLLITI